MSRARAEFCLSVLACVLAFVTVMWPTWVETVTGVDPDAGGGGAEWVVVGMCVCLAAVAAVDSRRRYRLAQPAT